ncbi:MAG: hypothetical protein AAB592_00190 [Patescibacteria group bacterium]
MIKIVTLAVTLLIGLIIGEVSVNYRKTQNVTGLSVTSEQSKCTKQGGYWLIGSVISRCILPYSDAGEKCTSSDQCLGQCVTNIISQLGKEGVCQYDTSNQGCFNAIESERFTCLMDDIMVSCDSKDWDTWCDSLKGELFELN